MSQNPWRARSKSLKTAEKDTFLDFSPFFSSGLDRPCSTILNSFGKEQKSVFSLLFLLFCFSNGQARHCVQEKHTFLSFLKTGAPE